MDFGLDIHEDKYPGVFVFPEERSQLLPDIAEMNIITGDLHDVAHNEWIWMINESSTGIKIRKTRKNTF